MAKKRCACCNGKLGLSAIFKNRWQGHWWEHLRFCSRKCMDRYEAQVTAVAAQIRWLKFLATSEVSYTSRPAR